MLHACAHAQFLARAHACNLGKAAYRNSHSPTKPTLCKPGIVHVTQPGATPSHAKFMEAEQKKWAMLECEPDVWLVLIVTKAWAGPGCSNDILQASLASLHSLFTLLHGPMSQLLEQVSMSQRVGLACQTACDSHIGAGVTQLSAMGGSSCCCWLSLTQPGVHVALVSTSKLRRPARLTCHHPLLSAGPLGLLCAPGAAALHGRGRQPPAIS